VRKIAFVRSVNEIRKLMIYQSNEGVYLFGYDCLQDASAMWDLWFATVHEAEEVCNDDYEINPSDWISISDPLTDCQHDFIRPTMARGRQSGKVQHGIFLGLVGGKWVELEPEQKYYSFDNLTAAERLVVSGLLREFETAEINDKPRAIRILRNLGIDDIQ
jgi:hypothetical protein